ncbi:unnamed protein product [Adineta steineri]|uniref:Secreted protein n=1 Tax=Adineta steineri TaxID=433720 RepID=A0A814BS47_9BILA|nr:unnamed protein product [Adineta steineri]CAF3622490.1 unnamed protein product [Adineta steineri]
MMHTFLIVIIICSCFGFISTSTIDSDLTDIINIEQDFKKYSPEIARNFTQTTCQMISKCCPQIQSKFISMALLGDTKGITDQCFDLKGSPNSLLNIISCSPLFQLTTMITNPDLLKYISLISKNSNQDKEDMKTILNVCSETEVYSIACNWNDSDQQSTCQRKVLEKWAEQGDKFYTDKVQQKKQDYIKLIDILKKEFHN